jgi:hypothetical protein
MNAASPKSKKRPVACGTRPAAPEPYPAYFFSMFHMGGTDGTGITPEILSDR